MKHLSSSITDFYIKRNIIKEDEKEVYQYGVELILNEVLTFGIILIYSMIAWKIRYNYTNGTTTYFRVIDGWSTSPRYINFNSNYMTSTITANFN